MSSNKFELVELTDPIGYGTMSLTMRRDSVSMDALNSLRYAHTKTGHFNACEFYGEDDINLKMMQKFIEGNDAATNSKIVISIKGMFNLETYSPDWSKESVDKIISKIKRYFPPREGRPKIILGPARVDRSHPVEDTISYISEYVKSGVIDGIFLSECGPQTIAKAASVFPITCVEVELSPVYPMIIDNGVMKECAAHNIAVVAYSPLAMGLLTTSTIEKPEEYIKSKAPLAGFLDRHSAENVKHNIKLAQQLDEMAKKRNVSLESYALSWITSLSENKTWYDYEFPQIIPIPSGSTKEKIDINFGPRISLPDDELKEIKKIIDSFVVKGLRFNSHSKDMEFA
ncbi:Piso0_002203 [Millerozyma farinosa CBS 7064]|uniref:Piso0_002203 protein n=1 Tax=Pichia sorbitophila (strain ATCC MYA-4447 / BCRC 22081 / CBS 7064 / NBRC 10061 / NRRL Y-12695) TaxID=559304 RepID=G8YBZ5_PICSO|nr:Piso0_002203 [Millerozyma farinosa CBS 7064]